MMESWKTSRAAWLVAGVLAGAVLAGLLPHAPLHAVATDRQENFAIATGHLDQGIEAVFYLDFLTGELKGTVISPQTGKFFGIYHTNILQDLGVDVTKNPKYVMCTGDLQLRRFGAGAGPAAQPAECAVYIADSTTGKCICYAMPWNIAMGNNAQPFNLPFVMLDAIQFRTQAIR
jgi:hypothetical protein